MFRPLILLLSILVLSACAGLGPREDSIKVNLSNLRMLESTLLEQRFEVSIRVQNRSKSALDIEGLSFDLRLNGKDFASGVSNQNATIDPLSEGIVSVNLTSTLFSLVRQFQSMQTLHTEPFRYEISGTFYTSDIFFGIPFSEEGEIDLTVPSSDVSPGQVTIPAY